MAEQRSIFFVDLSEIEKGVQEWNFDAENRRLFDSDGDVTNWHISADFLDLRIYEGNHTEFHRDDYFTMEVVTDHDEWFSLIRENAEAFVSEQLRLQKEKQLAEEQKIAIRRLELFARIVKAAGLNDEAVAERRSHIEELVASLVR